MTELPAVSAAPRRPGRKADVELHERRRREILAAAIHGFAQAGYSSTEMDSIAERLGMSKGTIYRYFPSKEALFLAAVDEGMNQLKEAIGVARESAKDPIDSITNAIDAYLAFFDLHPEFTELLIQERAHFKDRKTPTYFAHRDANLAPWRDLYRELIADGRVRDVPVDRILDVICQLVYGTMFTNYFAGRRVAIDQQFRDIVDIFFHGILTDGERRRLAARTAPVTG